MRFTLDDSKILWGHHISLPETFRVSIEQLVIRTLYHYVPVPYWNKKSDNFFFFIITTGAKGNWQVQEIIGYKLLGWKTTKWATIIEHYWHFKWHLTDLILQSLAIARWSEREWKRGRKNDSFAERELKKPWHF